MAYKGPKRASLLQETGREPVSLTAPVEQQRMAAAVMLYRGRCDAMLVLSTKVRDVSAHGGAVRNGASHF